MDQWQELLRLGEKVTATMALDDIHDLRVASRRFRAALELFCPFAPKRYGVELKQGIRSLTRMLGVLRNIDEALLFFGSRAPGGGPSDTTLCQRLSALRAREAKRMDKALKAFDRRTLDRMVRKMAVRLKGRSIARQHQGSLPAYFSDVSISLYLKTLPLFAVATAPEQLESRHALRIAIKKWRYFLEIVAPILDRDGIHLLELLKEYQSLLGRMNDIVEFQRLTGDLKLPKAERNVAEAALRDEDHLLLARFEELAARKPLSYTFLV
jgi:CHAD domain-containing protein